MIPNSPCVAGPLPLTPLLRRFAFWTHFQVGLSLQRREASGDGSPPVTVELGGRKGALVGGVTKGPGPPRRSWFLLNYASLDFPSLSQLQTAGNL